MCLDIDFCVDVTCSGNGQCVEQVNSFSCECFEGFTGEQCETGECSCTLKACQSIDEYVQLISFVDCLELPSCRNVVCENGGTCEVDEVSGITCNCADGFTGRSCEASTYHALNENMITLNMRCSCVFFRCKRVLVTTLSQWRHMY